MMDQKNNKYRLDLLSIRFQIATVLAFLEEYKHDGEAARQGRLAAHEIARITKMEEASLKMRRRLLYEKRSVE